MSDLQDLGPHLERSALTVSHARSKEARQGGDRETR